MSDLWAITSYFNPIGFRSRLLNYRIFRRHLSLPLLTIELSFGAAFELDGQDADVLLQLRGGDVMWQKERLLNVAIGALPEGCRKAVWMDCDVIVGMGDWAERVSHALDDHLLVQPFSREAQLLPGPSSDLSLATAEKDRWVPAPGDIESWRPSSAYEISTGVSASECLRRRPPNPQERRPRPGVMWAARRELLDACGYYDACIVGGGDLALVCAAYGCFEVAMDRQTMNDRQRECYLAWAQPYYKAVDGRVTYVDCPVYHVWHGSNDDRKYMDRHDGLLEFHFDPVLDLAIDQSGAWRWNSDKPNLHRYVYDYLAERKEDGGGRF